MTPPSSPYRGNLGPHIVVKPGGLVILTAITTIAVVGAWNVYNRTREVPVVLIQQAKGGGTTAPASDAPPPVAEPPPRSSGIPIENYSIEVATANPVLADHWQPFEAGYERDATVGRSGKCSIHMISATNTENHGARYILMLNQTEPKPLEFAAWSKASGVTGTTPGDYALYIDIENRDGTTIYGSYADFSKGTHDWEYRTVQIHPTKPIRHAKLYVLLRKHAGSAWFDDITCKPL